MALMPQLPGISGRFSYEPILQRTPLLARYNPILVDLSENSATNSVYHALSNLQKMRANQIPMSKDKQT